MRTAPSLCHASKLSSSACIGRGRRWDAQVRKRKTIACRSIEPPLAAPSLPPVFATAVRRLDVRDRRLFSVLEASFSVSWGEESFARWKMTGLLSPAPRTIPSYARAPRVHRAVISLRDRRGVPACVQVRQSCEFCSFWLSAAAAGHVLAARDLPQRSPLRLPRRAVRKPFALCAAIPAAASEGASAGHRLLPSTLRGPAAGGATGCLP